MHTFNLYEELFFFALLLLGVVGIYLSLKLHYVFAFGLMKNTTSYEKNKVKIDKVKQYLFFTLKVLLGLGLVSMFLFCANYLYEGMSLKVLLFDLWYKIPEGFWLSTLLVLVRIAVIIALSRYMLKIIYTFLDKQQQKTLKNRCKICTDVNIIKFYKHLHTMIKIIVLLGIVYRITLFFPFLEIISQMIGVSLLLYVVLSLGILSMHIINILKERRGQIV